MTINFDNGALDALARSPGITAEVKRNAERIAQIARSDAPVGDTGAYKNSIRVRVKYQRRSVAVVEATDPKSLIIEAKKGILARATKKAARKQ